MKITAEYARSRLDYDPETGVLRWKPREVRNSIDKMWNTRFAGTVISHENSTGHIQFGMCGRNHLAHRIAWLIIHGFCPPLIDHKNGIRNDNRLCNLRPATRSQNNSNTKLYKSNKHGFRGVWLNGKRWAATIRVNYQVKFLGNFPSKEQAAKAYDIAAREFRGEFARLNFPQQGE